MALMQHNDTNLGRGYRMSDVLFEKRLKSVDPIQPQQYHHETTTNQKSFLKLILSILAVGTLSIITNSIIR